MENIQSIILAAGRGSRMCALTKDKPKCLLQLLGKPLLHWQLESLRAAGLKDITVVSGYKNELLQGDFKKIQNTRWEQTNMVASLQCALSELPKKTTIISYADIVYTPHHVTKLLAAKEDIGITYDTLWQDLWAYRAKNTTDDILADAETFKQENGLLTEIGQKPQSLQDVQGQYMGLIKLSPQGIDILLQIFNQLGQEKVDKLDMTSLLSLLLQHNTKIEAVPVEGAWCECDTQADIQKYEQALQSKNWKHDWRI